MSGDFVNRTQDFIAFKNWIRTPSTKNKGIFVYAKSGIGKSRLFTELFKANLTEYAKIKVVMHNPDATSVDSYSYLKALYRKVIQETEKNSELPLKKRVFFDSNLTVSAYIGIGISWTEKTGQDESIAQIMAYLSKKLQEDVPFIIDIENFQSIDNESLECLFHLFRTGTKHRFVFEFTMNPTKRTTAFYHLFSAVNSHLDCQMYELKKLELGEVYALCERTGLLYDTAKDIYEENDGNLFPLIMLPYSSNPMSHQPLRDLIDDLGEDTKIILFLIELSRGEVFSETIEDMFLMGTHILTGVKKYSKPYVQSQCTILKNKKIVDINNHVIKICQDQLLETIVFYRCSPLYYLATALFENYHQKKLLSLSQDKGEEHVLALLHVYSIFSDPNVISILPRLTRIILLDPPQRIINKVRKIKSQLALNNENKRFVDYLTRYLADVCIATGQWKAALEQVDGCYSEDIPWQACYIAATLASSPELPDVESRIQRMREKHRKDLSVYMSLTVSLLSYYTRTVPELQVKKIGKVYLEEFEGIRNLNYAFLLKIHSNTLLNEEAISALTECNQIFEECQRPDLVAINKITIASRNVYMGHPEIGLSILDEAEQDVLKQDIAIRCHYFQNNRAAIHLLLGDYDEQTEHDLNAAQFSANSPFERAIILCNLMIYYTLMNQNDDAARTFQTLQSLDLSQYNNVDLSFIVKQNTLYYYEFMGIDEMIPLAKRELIELALSEDCPEDIRIHILGYFPDEYPEYALYPKVYLAKYRFHPDFIGYWQCEVCYDNAGKNHLTEILNNSDSMSFES